MKNRLIITYETASFLFTENYKKFIILLLYLKPNKQSYSKIVRGVSGTFCFQVPFTSNSWPDVLFLIVKI